MTAYFHRLPTYKTAVFFLPLIVLSAGCMHVRPIDVDFQSIDYVNRAAQGLEVLIHFNDGSYAMAHQLYVTPQTTHWVDPHTKHAISTPTADIFELQIKDRTGGMVDGLGLGILAGASLGMIAGLSMRPTDEEFSEHESTTASAGIVGGMLVGSLGLVIGSTRGATQCYRLSHSFDRESGLR